MVSDQQQASNNDLSQSAYDSALAGVEDAKRALLQYQQECSSNPTGCGALRNAINTAACNEALNGVIGRDPGVTSEVMVEQSSSSFDEALQQAYTCVTMQLETEDYIGDLKANTSQLVPLFSTLPFDKVLIQWFSKQDFSTSESGAPLDVETVDGSGNGQPLYSQGLWPLNRPSLMRAQLIQFASSYSLSSFDTVSGSQTNSASVFLYPTSVPPGGEVSLVGTDFRKTTTPGDEGPDKKLAGSTPTPISCLDDLNSGGYACSAILEIPEAVGATGMGDRTAFLRIMPFYNAAHFRITMWNGPVDLGSARIDPPKFKDVQPIIDSTGRANDLFRRVESRVNLVDTSFTYPEATIDVTGDFCKDFSVTDTAYVPSTIGCNP